MSDQNRTKPGAKLLAALKTISEQWLVELEIIDFKAKLCKARFDAALAHGFTEKQALEICTKEWQL